MGTDNPDGGLIIHELRPTHPTSNPPHPFKKVEAVAAEVVLNCRELVQSHRTKNKGLVVRSAGLSVRRPKANRF